MDLDIYCANGVGRVTVIDYMGGDLQHVNAARASFNKQVNTLGERDKRLLAYLAENKHTAPFRHSYVSFRIKAPLFVLRQWFKHVVGAQWVDTPWSEMSMRYVAPDEAWIPDYFRIAPDNKKQGSIDNRHPNTDYWLEQYCNHTEAGLQLYEAMVADGVAPEQARSLLGTNIYSTVVWTASVQAIAHFVNLRDDEHAQKEIQEYALIIDMIMAQLFPESWAHRKYL